MKIPITALKFVAAAILAAVIAPQCFAQDNGASEGVPEIAGIQVTPEFAISMSHDISAYLLSDKPDLSKLNDVFKVLSQANLNNPAVQKALTPVNQGVQTIAERLIYKAGPQLAHAGLSPAAAEAGAEKFTVLNQNLSPYLSPAQRRDVLPLAVQYRRRIDEETRARLDARLKTMAVALGTFRGGTFGGGSAVNASAGGKQLVAESALPYHEQLAKLTKPTGEAKISAPTSVPDPPPTALHGGRKIQDLHNGAVVILDANGVGILQLRGTVSLSPDGSRAISASYDAHDGYSVIGISEVNKIGHSLLRTENEGKVHSVSWSPDGNFAVVAFEGKNNKAAIIFDIKAHRVLSHFSYRDSVRSIWLNPDKSRLLVLVNKETIVAFDPKTGIELNRKPQLMTVAK